MNSPQLVLGFRLATISTPGPQRVRNYISPISLLWIPFPLPFFFSPVTASPLFLPYRRPTPRLSAGGRFGNTRERLGPWSCSPRCSLPLLISSLTLWLFVGIVGSLDKFTDTPIQACTLVFPSRTFWGGPLLGSSRSRCIGVIDQVCWKGSSSPPVAVRGNLLLGVGLYYGVLAFNLGVTFWIEEWLLGMVGCLIYLPISMLLILKTLGIFANRKRTVPSLRFNVQWLEGVKRVEKSKRDMVKSRIRRKNKDPRSKLRGIKRKNLISQSPHPLFQRGHLKAHPEASDGESSVNSKRSIATKRQKRSYLVTLSLTLSTFSF